MQFTCCWAMPGHMNVLLLKQTYEQLKDLDEVNSEFEDCVSLGFRANDVVTSARHDKSSPICGPILDVDKSRTVIINKRTMNTGFAGIGRIIWI